MTLEEDEWGKVSVRRCSVCDSPRGCGKLRRCSQRCPNSHLSDTHLSSAPVSSPSNSKIRLLSPPRAKIWPQSKRTNGAGKPLSRHLRWTKSNNAVVLTGDTKRGCRRGAARRGGRASDNVIVPKSSSPRSHFFVSIHHEPSGREGEVEARTRDPRMPWGWNGVNGCDALRGARVTWCGLWPGWAKVYPVNKAQTFYKSVNLILCIVSISYSCCYTL